MPAPTQTTHVTALRDVAPEVRELILAPPPERVEYRPGQWIGLHLPIGERPPLVRAYTLAAPPQPSGELLLCLDRVPGGLGSNYLFALQPGDPVTFAGPLGNFTLPEPPGEAELLWIARYTGIVPFRAMWLYLREHPPARPVTLLYSAFRPEDLAYLDEFSDGAEDLPWFRLVATVDHPDPAWIGRCGSALDLLPELVGERRDLLPMVCGRREFVRPIREFFYALGYERRAVKWENYD